MTTKVRKQIYLEKRQNQLLKRLAEARGVSEAEVIRTAINREAAVEGIYVGSEPVDFKGFLDFARERSKLAGTGEPYKWNREEIYAEREERLFRHVNEPREPRQSDSSA